MKERLIAAAILGVCVLFGAAIMAGNGVAKFGTGPDWVTIETPETPPPSGPRETIPTPPMADSATAETFESYQPNRSAAAATATLNALAARVTKLETEMATLSPRTSPPPTHSYTPTVTTIYETPTITYSPPWPSAAPVSRFAGGTCSGGVCRQSAVAPVVRRTFFRRY